MGAEEKKLKYIISRKISKKLTKPRTRDGEEPKSSKQGIILLKNEEKVYVSMSRNVDRRLREHKRYIRKGDKKGAGKFIQNVSDMEYCVLEFPSNLDPNVPLKFYKQELIDLLKNDGEMEVQNERNSMRTKDYQKCKEYIAKL